MRKLQKKKRIIGIIVILFALLLICSLMIFTKTSTMVKSGVSVRNGTATTSSEVSINTSNITETVEDWRIVKKLAGTQNGETAGTNFYTTSDLTIDYDNPVSISINEMVYVRRVEPTATNNEKWAYAGVYLNGKMQYGYINAMDLVTPDEVLTGSINDWRYVKDALTDGTIVYYGSYFYVLKAGTPVFVQNIMEEQNDGSIKRIATVKFLKSDGNVYDGYMDANDFSTEDDDKIVIDEDSASISYNSVELSYNVYFAPNQTSAFCVILYDASGTKSQWDEYNIGDVSAANNEFFKTKTVNFEKLSTGKNYTIKFEKRDGTVLATYSFTTLVDNAPPVVSDIESSNTSATTETVTLKATAIDESSGIVAYRFFEGNNDNEAWTTIENTKSSINLSYEVSENGTYYLEVKDEVGNVGSKYISVTNIGESSSSATIKVRFYDEKAGDTSDSYWDVKEQSNVITATVGENTKVLNVQYYIDEFSNWDLYKIVCDSETLSVADDGYVYYTPKYDKTYYLEVYFTRKRFDLTLSKDTGVDTVTGAGTYKYGQTVTISATAQDGYKIDGWTSSVSGLLPKETSSGEWQFTMPGSALTLTANAIATSSSSGETTSTKHSVTINNVTGATASIVGGITEYEAGKTVSITVTAESGYEFNGWKSTPTVSISENSGVWEFTMPDSDVTLTADVTKETTNSGSGSSSKVEFNIMNFIRWDDNSIV